MGFDMVDPVLSTRLHSSRYAARTVSSTGPLSDRHSIPIATFPRPRPPRHPLLHTASSRLVVMPDSARLPSDFCTFLKPPHIRTPPGIHPPSLNPSNPSSTSSPTPPLSTTIFTILATTALLTPPLGGLHTPPLSSEFPSPTPGCVVRPGGSTVLIARTFKPPAAAASPPTEMATTVSATASSAGEGSKRMVEKPTEMARRVIGGRIEVEDGVVDDCFPFDGYRCVAASQSSSKSGSSSPWDLRRGSRVERRARWVVRLRRGRG